MSDHLTGHKARLSEPFLLQVKLKMRSPQMFKIMSAPNAVLRLRQAW